jgi:peptidoglycan hydrolase CwlO-like protein
MSFSSHRSPTWRFFPAIAVASRPRAAAAAAPETYSHWPVARQRRKLAAGLTGAALLAAAIAFPGGSAGRTLSSQLASKRHALREERAREAALGSAIRRFSHEIERLAAEVARLQRHEAIVQSQLVITRQKLHRAEARLARIRRRYIAALKVLRTRLVSIYTSEQPSTIAVMLDSHGFDDLISRAQYLGSIQNQDNAIAARVERLRDEVRAIVNTLRAERDRLVAKRDELARTEAALRGRQASLAVAKGRKEHALAAAKAAGHRLQEAISSLESKVAAQSQYGLGIASGQPLPPLDSGAIPPGTAISPFPASYPVVWGRTDQGIDGTTTPGALLLAMGSGTVTIQHDPYGFGVSYPVLSTSFGDFYYGHCVPVVADGAQVRVGQQMAMAHYGTWGNSTTPGGFEIGRWPPGSMTAGAAIRDWLIGLPRVR